MKMTIDAMFAKKMFKDDDRDYFTTTALETILNYYDEIDENAEFDVIAICCDWNEYGDGSALGFSDFINDYGYLMDDEEFFKLDKDEQIEALIEELEEHTYITRLENSNVLVQVF